MNNQKNKGKREFISTAQKGFKNDRGDYVVTSINIPDMRTDVKKNQDEDSEDVDPSDSESEGYGDEEDSKDTQQ